MNTVRLNHCAIVLLAAGISGRMGTPKQVLVYEGKSLLRRSVEAALGTGIRPVFVILGANHVLLEKEMENIKEIRIVFNHGWPEGMAASIRCGVAAAMQLEPDLDGLIMMVCDQPFVSSELLEELLHTQHQTGKPVVASSYLDKPGVPAFFHKSFFSNLMALQGDTGARKILKDQAALVALVPFPEGATDIDTISDFNGLNKLKKEERRD